METEPPGLGVDGRVVANLRAAREAAGLTQKQLAQKMRDRGWSTFYQQTVTRYEAGQRALTTGEADALADALGTDLLALMNAPGVARQAREIRHHLTDLLETRRTIRDLRMREANLLTKLERLAQEARDGGHAGQLGQELAAVRALFASGQEENDERHAQAQR